MSSNRKFIFLNFIVLICFIFVQLSIAQDKPIKIKILSSFQNQNSEYKESDASGYGLGAQMNFSVIKNLDFCIKLHFDNMSLKQHDVLDEWEWDYWEKTYIDFLPGAEPEIVNQTLKYTSTDSIYSAIFEPTQRLKELRLFAGFEYNLPVTKKIKMIVGVDGGLSIFFRELQMEEHWIKRYKLDTLTTGKFDYEYQFDLLHFAPAKKGKMVFVSPSFGIQYYLTPSIDLMVGASYLHYLHREELFGIKVSSLGPKWYPIKSKMQFAIGLTFKY